MMRSLITGVCVASVLVLTACENGEKAERPAAATQPAMGMLNSTCPLSGNPVDPDAKTAEYHGHKIGFCCNNCVGGWEKKTDAEKQAIVAKYTK